MHSFQINSLKMILSEHGCSLLIGFFKLRFVCACIMNILAFIVIIFRSHSWAATLATNVFPVPGGPYSKIPVRNLKGHWEKSFGYWNSKSSKCSSNQTAIFVYKDIKYLFWKENPNYLNITFCNEKGLWKKQRQISSQFLMQFKSHQT